MLRGIALFLSLAPYGGCRRTDLARVDGASLVADSGSAVKVASRAPQRSAIVEDNSPAVSADGTMLVDNVGIETLGGVMTVVFEKGIGVPCDKKEVFSTASDRQTELKITMYRGGAPQVKDDHRLGTFEIRAISPAPRGVPVIKVTFSIEGRRLRIAATDSTSNPALEIVRVADAPPPR